MTPEEELITQMGLLLTQMRYARHALENIEQATANYAGIVVSVTGGGTAIGAPPLTAGALRVYVTNIGELVSPAQPGGVGDFLGGLLGGIGRFIGGLVGGTVGGVVGGIALPYNLAQMSNIAERVERIIRLLHLDREPPTPTGGATATPETSTFDSRLAQFTGAIDRLTAMFTAASQGGGTTDTPTTEPIARWLGTFRELNGVIDGLIILVPMLMGFLASFLVRLDDIKLAIVGMLAFVVENLLLLRGVALVTVFDTIASAASLASEVLGIAGAAFDRIIGSVITVLTTAFETAVLGIQLLGTGLKATVDALMTWLRDGLGAFLLFLGDTRVFRLVFHIADVLPLILPALQEVIQGKPFSDPHAISMLQEAASRPIPGLAGAAGPAGGVGGATVPFPDLGEAALPSTAVADFQAQLSTAATVLHDETARAFGTAQGALTSIGAAAQARLSDTAFDATLEGHRAAAAEHAHQLSLALQPARDAYTRERPEDGLRSIATAYESWLSGGGLSTIMERITDHLQRTPTGPGAEGSLLGRLVDAVSPGEARATIEIGEVVIEVGPPPATSLGVPQGSLRSPLAPLGAHVRDVLSRGGDPDDPDHLPLHTDAVFSPA